MSQLLEVRDLRVAFATESGRLAAVDGVSFAIQPGAALGIVGESGSGKSVMSLAVMRLLRGANVSVEGEVLFDGHDLLGLSEAEMRRVRGNEIAMVFQDPLSSLHPLKRVGGQVAEAVRAHSDVTRAAARARAVELLELVELREPYRVASAYPHELSGGMRQRAMIAMGLANEPRLLLADEPTTALDVTVQAQILALLSRLREELGMALVIVTHDLGVIAQTAEEVAVMYAGRIVERAPTATLFRAPEHPYTWGLLRSMPRLDTPRDVPLVPIVGSPPSLLTRPSGCSFHPRCPHVRDAHRRIDPPLEPTEGDLGHEVACLLPPATRRELEGRGAMTEPLLQVRDLVKHFPPTFAVDGVSFDVAEGEAFGIVGETGSGKTTLARMIARLIEPTAGSISFGGRWLATLSRAETKALRRDLAIVFQDPYSSLNPRKTVGSIVAEPFAVHGLHPGRGERRRAVSELMERVGLDPEHLNRQPHEFSGGQRQRIGIARALALGPRMILADEPVSALDVSIQAQILNLLRDLRRDLGLTLLLISHDLSVVRYMCERVAVMRDGRIVEMAATEKLFEHPQHEYTRALLAAVPAPSPDL